MFNRFDFFDVIVGVGTIIGMFAAGKYIINKKNFKSINNTKSSKNVKQSMIGGTRNKQAGRDIKNDED